MRLIDADKLTDDLGLWGCYKYENPKAYDTLMLYEILGAIEDQPTAYDVEKALEKTRWIPCSERMPEDVGQEYLLTWRERWGEDNEWEYNVDCVTFVFETNPNNVYYLGRWEFDWDFWEGQECEAVAWMPMPEPYKECE